MSPSAQAQANVESDKLARFVALMQYIRTQPTPSDVHSNTLGTLDILDEALTDICVEGFIAPFTGETAEEVRQRLESVPGEDRYAAAMVESYRLASSPVLLDTVHDLLARYYVDLLTTGDLTGALGFMGKAEIQTLTDEFASADYAIPAPPTVQGSGVPSPSARTVSEVESDTLARFVALMQYIRTQPTPSDVHSNALGILDILDDSLTDIYIDAFIAPFTGEAAEEVRQRLKSASEEDRYAAAMVESYRLASSPVLLDIVHDLLARYYVDLLTTGDLSRALGFMDKSEIQELADGFNPEDYAIGLPSAAEPEDIGSIRMDRAALMALYNATDGPNWRNNTNWLSSKPIGDWYGVTTNAGGRVSSLVLNFNGLNGQIPIQFGDLTALVELRLNGFADDDPDLSALSDLPNLRHSVSAV